MKATANLGMCSCSCFPSCLCSLAREAGCLCPHLPGLLCRPVFQSSTWQALKALSLLPSAMPMKTLASAWRKVLISSFSEKAGAARGQNSARSYLGIPSVPVSPKYNHKLWCHFTSPSSLHFPTLRILPETLLQAALKSLSPMCLFHPCSATSVYSLMNSKNFGNQLFYPVGIFGSPYLMSNNVTHTVTWSR